MEQKVTIIDCGAFISEDFTCFVFNTATNFRLVKVSGFKRVVQSGQEHQRMCWLANSTKGETGLFVSRPSDNGVVWCLAFDVDATEVPLAVSLYHPHPLEQVEVGGLVCLLAVENQDVSCISSDIAPIHPYLEHCLKASSRIEHSMLENILDDSFLSDGETTIRDYLRSYFKRGGSEK